MRLFSTPTSDEWLFIGIVFFLVVTMIFTTELVRRLLNGNSEITRKFVHIVVGILMAFAPLVFHSAIPAILISIIAIVGTWFSVRLGYLKSLHDTERKSFGTVFHPLSFLILIFLFWENSPEIISISILILAIPDALAAIIGQRTSNPHYFSFSSDRKTVEGSATMFVSTFLLLYIFLWFMNVQTHQSWLIISATSALFIASWELLCTKGLDNLTVPLSAGFLLHFFLFSPTLFISDQMVTAILLGIAIGIISHIFKFLSTSGSIATFILATIIFGIGGWSWTIPILVFFISSSLLSKIDKSNKRKLQSIFDKTDKRDAVQVAANGGVAGIIILLWYLFPERNELYFLYVGSIAAATADTWGTEIGTMIKGKPLSIISLEPVEPGTSGGISIAGIFGGILGAFLISFFSMFSTKIGFTTQMILSIVFSGFIGTIVDSILGGTLQAQYQSDDGKLTEKTMMNDKPTRLVHGYKWMNNDTVNWLCAFSGAITMYFLL